MKLITVIALSNILFLSLFLTQSYRLLKTDRALEIEKSVHAIERQEATASCNEMIEKIRGEEFDYITKLQNECPCEIKKYLP